MDLSLNFPALHASHAGIWVAMPGEAPRRIAKGEAVGRAAETPHILLNAPLVAERLGYPELSGLDLLELWAFVHPARFVVPTPAGLARGLGLDLPSRLREGDPEPDPHQSIRDPDVPTLLHLAAERLLATLADPAWPEREGAWSSAQALFRLRWPWAGEVSKRIAAPSEAERWLFSRLPEWEDQPPRGAPKPVPAAPEAALERLETLTGQGAERRQGQRDYSATAAQIFAPRGERGQPHLLLAEAGTGIGKTLGYLAPASLWAERAHGTVWISTYTKALQRQLNAETRRIHPEPGEHARRVVVRKGRENYLCLLNLEDALQGGFAGRAAMLAQLVARWAAYSRDGDMVGGDLPGWLTTLFRRAGITALTDRRGECIYAGCPHYRKCFIERAARASRQADLVIANHALVMVNAARGREGEARPTRIIFDEGHHLFDAADSMFSAAFTGQEIIEMRRWIIGPEGRSRGRRRGLAARLADVASYDEKGGKAIEDACLAATALPGEGWLARLQEGIPSGPIEELLARARGTVYARDESQAQDAGYGLECELADLDSPLIEAAAEAARAVDAILRPLITLGQRLQALIEDPPDWMDAQARARIDGAISSLGWRVETLGAWSALLGRVGGPGDPDFVDWLTVDRYDGREFDVGLRRHWLDPGKPLAKTVIEPAHGVMMTSATLRAGDDWAGAEARTGVQHVLAPVTRFAVESPFDYARRAEVLIVTDVKRGDMAALAGAYASLIMAAKGGALGLFTAIRRLRAVHGRIADRLAAEGLPLHAQHVDPIDTGTLVDIFRDDPRASLLGTDALRDGVDVPGDSLRLVVMEGVPWPKPDILHKARRLAFVGQGSPDGEPRHQPSPPPGHPQSTIPMGGQEGERAGAASRASATKTGYDDRIIRARLAQAFGRLIRSRDDAGQFVMLSAAFPSRLLSAFPAGTPIRRLPLAEAVAAVQNGVGRGAALPHDSVESGEIL